MSGNIVVDGVFNIQDITPRPVYHKYPFESTEDLCFFNYQLVVSCIGFNGLPTLAATSSSGSIGNYPYEINSTSSYNVISISSPITSTESTATLEFSGCGYSGANSKIQFNYQCHEIDLNSISFTASPSNTIFLGLIKAEGYKYPISFTSSSSITQDLSSKSYSAYNYRTDLRDNNIITKNCTIQLDFYNKPSIILQIPPIYKDSKINIISNVNIYPPLGSTYTQTSYQQTSTLEYNLLSDTYYPFLQLIYYNSADAPFRGDYSFYPMYSNSDGSIRYYFKILQLQGSSRYSLYYQQNDIAISAFDSQYYQYTPFTTTTISYSTMTTNLSGNIFAVSINAGGGFDYTITPFYISDKLNTENSFPFGITKGLLDYQFNATIIVSNLYREITFGIINPTFRFSINADGIPEKNPPVVKSIESHYIGKAYYIIRIEASDDSGLSMLHSSISTLSGPLYMQNILVSGDLKNGIFEFLYLPDNFITVQFTLYDIYGNTKSVSDYQPYSYQPLKIFSYSSLLERTMLNSSSALVSFEYYEMNVTDQDAYNTMYLKVSDETITSDLSIRVNFELNNVAYGKYYAKYDQVEQRYYVKFTIKKNSMRGPLKYTIYLFPYLNIIQNGIFKSDGDVMIASNTVDTVGPLITSISKLSSDPVDLNLNSSMVFGWDITISDQYNGFSNGYIVVNGLSDGSIYNFTLEAQNDSGAVSFAENSFKLIISNASCISQTFQINTVALYDNMDKYSYFDRTQLMSLPYVINPLSRFLGDDSTIQINVACKPTIEDPTPPVLVSITPNVSSIDVGSNTRALSFEIQVADPDSGINTSQSPTVYITSLFSKTVECKSKLKSCTQDATRCTFKCETEIPFGFGYNNELYYQVYGIWNRNGMLSGYNHINIQDLFSSDYIFNISTTYSKDIPVITNTNMYTNSNDDLLIIGKSIGTAKSVRIIYNNTITTAKPICNYSSYCVIQANNYYLPFTIQIQTDNNKLSNIYTVLPIIDSIRINNSDSSNYSSSSNDSDSSNYSSSSNSSIEQQCPGDPVCGGPSKGFCTSKGCVCYDPWVGNQCQYKTIIVPQPSFNGTDPNITIIVPNENNSDQVQFTSLTSIISIRELDLTNNAIGTYRFERWINNQINSTFNEYYSNFTNINNRGKTTQVKVTIQWFDKQTNITFADSTLSMSPSSVKYTIQIKDYPFISTLNQLQIVMSASFKSNDNQVCSDKEFGDTNGWDDSNYLKIKVGDHSLYARFIKRGIIDSNRTVTLSNSILDNSFKTIEESNELQSYIGITIQNFESEVLIDPDFSILLDSSPSSNAICKSSGLTTSQLVGIIIGSVAFVAVVVVCITYFIIKKKNEKNFQKKLKSIELK